MTETEWLTSEDPKPIIELLWSKVSDRKLRLIACGCCRQIWNLLSNPRSREAVEVSERFADGLATDDELSRASWRAEAAIFAVDEKRERLNAEERAIRGGWLPPDEAVEAPFLPGVDGRPILLNQARLAACVAEFAADHPGNFLQQVDRSVLSLAVVRDVVGNPFRPVTLDQNWLTSTVIALAKQMYESRDFTAMPILADALQNAGCDNDDVLNHCRGAGPHVRGCWVVDLVLGKV